MPFYNYKCKNCDNQIEEEQSINDEALVKCQNCGEDRLYRVVGSGIGISFKGSGFYSTDNKK